METPLELEAWSEFNVAMLGGTAALVGLLIVAMSVNIKDILAAEPLPARAAAAVATLTLALVVCALGLVPGQPLWAYGAEAAVGTAVLAVVVIRAVRSVYRSQGAPRGTRFPKAVLILAPVLAYAGGSVLLLAGDAAGLAWLGTGAVLGVIGGASFAWVALIEILR
ncbi:hypothetical protein [Arthrobacter sp.]|uniref:hypothetical protein n=1 Tax=Arthrobacter sp. TaxID=1667 RepID=UPI00289B48FF|nr:hypothetical protein [Arthrobacter sp.]